MVCPRLLARLAPLPLLALAACGSLLGLDDKDYDASLDPDSGLYLAGTGGASTGGVGGSGAAGAVAGAAGVGAVAGAAGVGAVAGAAGKAGAAGLSGASGQAGCLDSDPARDSDLQNCGTCGHACVAQVGEIASCELGSCHFTCQAQLVLCGGVCVAVLSDPQNCGGCGKTCGPAEVCNSGVCKADCSASLTKCGGSCVDTSTSATNCGECGHPCTPLPGGSASCLDGTCVQGCDDPKKVCAQACVDTRVDTENCGACGNKCPSPLPAMYGVATCEQGICGGSCAPDRLLCHGPANGADDPQAYCALGTSAIFCGDCSACAGGQECKSGSCAPIACPLDRGLCDAGVCADLRKDTNNCGQCGVQCSEPMSCINGQCALPGGLCGPKEGSIKSCSGSCVDTQSDPDNCGFCGLACPDSLTCVGGNCVGFAVPAEPWECSVAGRKCCQHPVSGRPMCVSAAVACAPCE